ncbi:MAG: CRISPR-associated endonuclease Cas2 [Myxococcota bacterium]|nr:CRISPR-associated endonuclease Cas2 [Myxococcota bacterium]
MRNRYLVTYDISDDKRLRLVFRRMRSFGLHVQFSVFECELSARELAIMRAALAELIKHDEDQVIVADLGPADGRGTESISSLGRRYEPVTRKAVVV